MKSRPFILRCIAFFLILVFSQKAGAGLFLHNLLHRTTTDSKRPIQGNEKNNEFSYNCNCIDNFLIPFAEADEPICPEPVFILITRVAFFEDKIPFHTFIFSSLRGPPVNLV
jgi:hypothetical protein